jgi:single-stranded-DNA-specific exonuclease
MPDIVHRPIDAAVLARLVAAGCDPRLARLYAARGLRDAAELETRFASLASPRHLAHVDDAARLLADAI